MKVLLLLLLPLASLAQKNYYLQYFGMGGSAKVFYKESSSTSNAHYGGGIGVGVQQKNLRYSASVSMHNFYVKTVALNNNNAITNSTISNTFFEMPLGIYFAPAEKVYPVAGMAIVPGYKFFSTFKETGLKHGQLDVYNDMRNKFTVATSATAGIGFKINSNMAIEIAARTQYYILSNNSKSKEHPLLIGGIINCSYNLCSTSVRRNDVD